MNVAFSAVVALVLILPGFIFLKTLLGSESGQPLTPQPLSTEAVVVIFGASICHAIWWFILQATVLKCLGVQVKLAAVIEFLSGKFAKDDPAADGSLAAFADYPFHILGYMVGVCVLAGIAGLLVKHFFRELLATSLLQPYGAGVREWKEYFKVAEDEDGVAVVSTVVEFGGAAWLFVGCLDKLGFDPKTGGLDRLILCDVFRRMITPDEDKKEQEAANSMDAFYGVLGDFFVLRYSEVKTLNIVYADIKETS